MMLILMIVAVVVAMAATAGPAVAQVQDKAAAKAAKKAERQAARKAERQAARAAQKAQNVAPADASAKKALPATGGISAGTVALLGSGALIVGGGLVVHRAVRR